MKDFLETKLFEDYWKEKLKCVPVFNNDYKKVTSTSSILINENSLKYFLKLTSGNEVAEYTVLLSLYNALIYRYFETKTEVIFSYNLTNQEKKLLFNIQSIKGETFKTYLQEVKKEVQEVYQFSEYDESLSRKLPFEKYATYGFSYDAKQVVKKGIIPFFLCVNKKDKGLELIISFDPSVVKDYVAEHLLQNFQNWLLTLSEKIDCQIDQIDLLSVNERNQILFDFNNTTVDYPKDKTIVDLFEEQVRNIPNNIAVIFEEKQLTYKELNEQSNQLAHSLVTHYSIKKGQVIGVMLLKSIDFIISYLAILKVGGVYLPIDTAYPKARIDYMLEDSNALFVVSHSSITELIDTKVPIVNLDRLPMNNVSTENLNLKISSSDLAYLIYTSGSTGKPKGVLVKHTSNVNMSLDQIRQFEITKKDNIVWFASVAFDASISEIMMSLYSGATLIIPTEEQIKDQRAFKNLVKKRNISVATFSPSYLSILDVESLKDMRCIITAGESANSTKAKEIVENGISYYNAYGPTEYSVCTTIYKVLEEDKTTNIPIGKPIANTQVYILDDNFNPVPVGVQGILYVSGVGLAREYINQPELTEERFIPNPFEDKVLMYNTGDLAKWLPDGNIEFLGRKDFQIKIRGHRVELGEVEHHLSQFSNEIQQVIAEIKTINKNTVLVAYYVSSSNQDIDKNELRLFLKERLPEYMMPSFFIRLKGFPLTPNGKIDRKSLPDVDEKDLKKETYVAPRNEIERKLIDIWQEVLGVEKVGITDNFFELGGHSLLAGKIINCIYKQLNGKITFREFFQNPTVKNVSKIIRKEAYTPIAEATQQAHYPLTPLQQAIWVQQNIDRSIDYYNLISVIKIKGRIDLKRLENAFKALIRENEILRTSFAYDDKNEIRMYIEPEVDFKIAIYPSERSTEDIILNELSKKNELTQAPLMWGTIQRKEADEHILIFMIHHIISDGWSVSYIKKRIVELYFEKNVSDVRNLQFKDYAVWYQSLLERGELDVQKEYWISKFKGSTLSVDLPNLNFIGDSHISTAQNMSFELPKDLLLQINQYKNLNNKTLFDVLLGGIMCLLHRYSNQNEITVAVPHANRNSDQVEKIIGPFLNTILVNLKFSNNSTYNQISQTLNDDLLTAYENTSYPFELWLPKIQDNKSNLFNVMVVLQNFEDLFRYSNEDLEFIELNPNLKSTPQYDIIFRFFRNREYLSLNVEYKTDLFDNKYIERLIQHFESLLSKLLESPEEKINNIDYLLQKEKFALTKFNDTNVSYSKDKNYIDIFKLNVKRNPRKTAIKYKDLEVSYEDLNALSDKFSSYLIVNFDINKGDRICVKIDKSEKLLPILLGILKTGACYVPIDPNYPLERKKHFEDISNPKLVVDDSFVNVFYNYSGQESKFPMVDIPSDTIFHIMFTSGTTGNPKGVMLSHRNIVNFIQTNDYFSVDENTILLSTVATSFDTTNLEFWSVMAKGGTIILDDKKELLNYDNLKKLINLNKVNSLWLTASWFPQVVDYDLDVFKPLKQFITGGDVVSSKHVEKLKNRFPNLKVMNGYGPTECTTFATTFEITRTYKKAVPIGSPINNTQIQIFNDSMIPQPIGIYGEVYIGGDGVALGYFNNKELTDSKFIQYSKSDKKTTLYKTGDLARWLPDGTIDFFGRMDSQIKIRGHRIEPVEIEQTIIEKIPEIIQVVVVLKEIKHSDFLVAYFVSENHLNLMKVKDKLRKFFPDFMIPTYFINLEELPLTPNGKIDRKEFPLPTDENLIHEKYEAPKTKYEKQLYILWQGILKIERISIHDNFFDLGATSLNVHSLLHKISNSFNYYELSFADIYENPVFNKQLRFISNKVNLNSVSKHNSNIDNYKRINISSTQERWLLVNQISLTSSADNIVQVLPKSKFINKFIMKNFLVELIDKQEILRSIFQLEDGMLYQKVLDNDEVEIKIEELSTQKSQEDLLIDFKKNVFDYSKPLFKVVLVNNETFILCVHHLICDANSFSILYKSFEQYMLYREIEKPEVQYKDYSLNQIRYKDSKQYKLDKGFWLKMFSISEFRKELNMINSEENNHGIFSFILDQYVLKKLYHIKDQLGQHSMFIILLCFHIRALKKSFDISKQLLIGVTFDDRILEFKSVIGHFAKMVIVKDSNSIRLDELCKELQFDFLESIRHSDYQIHNYLKEMKISLNSSEYPITGIHFNMLQPVTNNIEYSSPNYTIEDKTTRFDFYSYVQEYGNGIEFNIVLDSNKISRELAFLYLQNLQEDINKIDFEK